MDMYVRTECQKCLCVCNTGVSCILVLRLSFWPLRSMRRSHQNYRKASFKPLNVCVTFHCKIRFRVIVRRAVLCCIYFLMTGSQLPWRSFTCWNTYSDFHWEELGCVFT